MRKLFLLFIFIFAMSCSKGLQRNYTIEDRPPFRLQPSDSLRTKWEQKVKGFLVDVKTLNDKYILLTESRGGLTVLNLETGKKEDNYWSKYKNPVQLYGVIDHKLFFSSEEKKEVICWNLLTSEFVWKKKLKHDYDSMVIHSDTLYFQAVNALAAVNAVNGGIIKTRQINASLRPGLVNYGDSIIGIDVQGTLRIFSKQLKPVETNELDVAMAQPLVQHSNTLLVYNTDGKVKRFSLLEKRIVYSRDFERTLYAKPLLLGNVLVVPFADGVVHAYDMTSNALQWTFQREGLLNINPVYIDEKLVLFYARGEIVILDMKNRNRQWRYDTEKSIDFAALTPRGILVSHHKKCRLIGVSK